MWKCITKLHTVSHVWHTRENITKLLQGLPRFVKSSRSLQKQKNEERVRTALFGSQGFDCD